MIFVSGPPPAAPGDRAPCPLRVTGGAEAKALTTPLSGFYTVAARTKTRSTHLCTHPPTHKPQHNPLPIYLMNKQ